MERGRSFLRETYTVALVVNRLIKKRIVYLGSARNIHTIRWAMYFSQFYDVVIISLDSCDIPNVSVTKITSRFSGLIKYIAIIPTIWSHLIRIKPVLIHAHYAGGYALAASLSKFAPVILSVWGSDVYINPKESKLKNVLLKFVFKRSDYICSTSNAMSMEIGLYTDKPVYVTPFGIDVSIYNNKRSAYSRKKPEVIIGTVKKLDYVYGVDRLIKAFKIALNNSKNKALRLLIAGDGPQLVELIELTRQLELQDQVTFLGQIKQSDVPKVLNTLDIFVALSRSESFGVAVLEASACEVPVIVSNVGGLPEVVHHNVTGIVVGESVIQNAATELLRLIESEHLRIILGANGRNFVKEKYNWDDNANIMHDLYKKVECETYRLA